MLFNKKELYLKGFPLITGIGENGKIIITKNAQVLGLENHVEYKYKDYERILNRVRKIWDRYTKAERIKDKYFERNSSILRLKSLDNFTKKVLENGKIYG